MSRAPERFPEKLVDKFGRTVDYVRISVTDRCDFRCVYCMDEEMEFLPRDRILTLEELELVGTAFAELGVTKIRLTGGEPLVRKDVITLIENLGTIQSLKELVITTNGSQLVKLALPLKNAGVKRINISLDSLNPKKFKELTRTGELKQVLDGIKAAKAANFEKIKINAVILKNRNDDEVKALVDFSADNDLDISFIEEMPLGVIGEHDRAEAYYSSDNIKADLEKHYTLIPTPETTAGPSKYFRVAETGARIGFISPHSHNFCDDCNRVRLTAEGRLLLCLGQEHSVDLRAVLRT
ncbi:MAG: GTP 3',8-cyclase MoaA, partial [Proteobacteria bacterium]|nr:GTP 3',8-cyclase MoaA [Pseudomonadota bacterium]